MIDILAAAREYIRAMEKDGLRTEADPTSLIGLVVALADEVERLRTIIGICQADNQEHGPSEVRKVSTQRKRGDGL